MKITVQEKQRSKDEEFKTTNYSRLRYRRVEEFKKPKVGNNSRIANNLRGRMQEQIEKEKFKKVENSGKERILAKRNQEKQKKECKNRKELKNYRKRLKVIQKKSIVAEMYWKEVYQYYIDR